MAEEPDERQQEANLELPSLLGFRRRRKERKASQAEPQDVAQDVSQTEPETPTEAPTQAAEITVEQPAVEQPAVEQPVVEQPALVPDPVEPPPTPPVQVPEPAIDPVEQYPVEPEPEPEPVPEPEPEPEPEQTIVIPPVPPASAVPAAPAAADTDPVHEGGVLQTDLAQPELDLDLSEEPARPRSSLPLIDPRIAAVLTGIVVGLVGVALASLAGRGCESIRGVGSCGGLGLLALLAVLAVEVVLGSIMLRAWRLSDPTSTSFLGVGLVAVVALLFFLSALDSVWMFLVLPLVTGVMFFVSWWVGNTFVEGSDNEIRR